MTGNLGLKLVSKPLEMRSMADVVVFDSAYVAQIITSTSTSVPSASMKPFSVIRWNISVYT